MNTATKPRTDTGSPGLLEVVNRVRTFGPSDALRRVVRRVYRRLDVGSIDFPLLAADIADSTRLGTVAPPTAASNPDRLVIGWICTPPSRGSGGHTTLLRMVTALEARGHKCVLYLYNRHGGDLARHERVIRDNWPGIHADVRDARESLGAADAYVASSWETAHVLAARPQFPGARVYYIQDFEPLFYPRGTLSALAEDSYRFGFHNISTGEMVKAHLTEIGIPSAMAPFGCDTAVYTLMPGGRPRSGVVFYAKPGSDRRGYLLAKLALEEFHRRHPEEPIHHYGDASGTLKFPAIQHGKLSPAALNDLYNSVKAGLATSFTNVSLVAEELLASGAIPIITDSPLVRLDMPSPFVEWAIPTPGGLADALSRAVAQPESPGFRAAIAGSVRHGWAPAQNVVAETILAAVRKNRGAGSS